MLPIVNPLPILLTFTTLFGVLVHDVHIDKAAALALPVVMASYAAAEAFDKVPVTQAHIHVERPEIPRSFNTFRSSLPKSQPTRDDDRKYVQNKKAHLGFGSDQGYVWPSA